MPKRRTLKKRGGTKSKAYDEKTHDKQIMSARRKQLNQTNLIDVYDENENYLGKMNVDDMSYELYKSTCDRNERIWKERNPKK